MTRVFTVTLFQKNKKVYYIHQLVAKTPSQAAGIAFRKYMKTRTSQLVTIHCVVDEPEKIERTYTATRVPYATCLMSSSSSAFFTDVGFTPRYTTRIQATTVLRQQR